MVEESNHKHNLVLTGIVVLHMVMIGVVLRMMFKNMVMVRILKKATRRIRLRIQKGLTMKIFLKDRNTTPINSWDNPSLSLLPSRE